LVVAQPKQLPAHNFKSFPLWRDFRRIAAEPGESSHDAPAARQDNEALQVVAALADFAAWHRNFGDGGFALPRVVAHVL
jgi:hypothetical protein